MKFKRKIESFFVVVPFIRFVFKLPISSLPLRLGTV